MTEYKTKSERGDSVRCALSIAVLVAMSLALGTCAGALSDTRSQTANQTAVSSAPIVEGAPFSAQKPPRPVEFFYGEGICAPVFPDGRRGTCINNQPCNGFGFKDARGRINCACFATAGGCGQGEICSTLRQKCVPQTSTERPNLQPPP